MESKMNEIIENELKGLRAIGLMHERQVKEAMERIANVGQRQLVYLASPYSHPLKSVREYRFKVACEAAGTLMAQGMLVFSPIAHTHPIADFCTLPKGWEFWEKFDRAFIGVSRALIVLTIDGWKESTGVQAEIKIAKELGIPVDYLWPEGAGSEVQIAC
jgi:hypothetical protein